VYHSILLIKDLTESNTEEKMRASALTYIRQKVIHQPPEENYIEVPATVVSPSKVHVRMYLLGDLPVLKPG